MWLFVCIPLSLEGHILGVASAELSAIAKLYKPSAFACDLCILAAAIGGIPFCPPNMVISG